MDSQKLSLLLNAVLVVVIIVLIVFGVQKGNFDGVNKKTLKSEYISIETYNDKEREVARYRSQVYEKDREIATLKQKQRELSAKLQEDGSVNDVGSKDGVSENKQCNFEDLDETTKQNYMKKEVASQQLERLKQQIRQLQNEDTQPQSSSDKSETKALPKQKENAKARNQVQDSSKEVKFTLTCSDHRLGSYYMDKKCQDKVLAFINKYGTAYAYDVIGVVDKHDFAVISGLKKIDSDILQKLHIQNHHIKQLEDIAPLGLARARAKEVMQLLKFKLGKDALVKQASYELILPDKRGFVIQASPLQK